MRVPAVRLLLVLTLCVLAFVRCAGIKMEATRSAESRYPSHWWKPVSKEQAASWEVLPQEALAGEVILSKRNELGLLS